MSSFDELSYTTPPSPPFDSISSIRYSPTNPDQLLVSSWDTTVRFYEIGENGVRKSEARAKFDHRAAVLACSFSPDGSRAYSGGLDTSVRELDLSTEKITNLGTHNDSISSMTFARSTNSLITGSWDHTLRFWDPRVSNPQQNTYQTPERIYAIDHVNNTLVVAMASRLFHIYDIRKMDTPAQQRESSLKYMTRSLACMPDGQGYATASVEGRIAVEYFDPSPAAQEKKYAFKCHRQTIDDVDHVWPVNALAFHPTYNTFASAGSDGTVSIWDHKVKKRLRQYPKYPGPVAAVAFNCDGTKIAVGVSYTWDEGEAGLKTSGVTPWLGVRKVGDEVKVRCPFFTDCCSIPSSGFLFVSGCPLSIEGTQDA
ncbi:WD40-repeat-containing domain protein [Flammula alnicola]|nr:WD40-repeat-containing domain protein [Flammula alnicola]